MKLTRTWSNRQQDSGSVHCLGNGSLAVYERGPDIFQIFGPPYSAPSFLELQLSDSAEVEVKSQRGYGTAIWNHTIYKGGRRAGEITDFVDSRKPCFIRHLHLTEEVFFSLHIREDIAVTENGCRFPSEKVLQGLLAVASPGTYLYGKYPILREQNHQIVLEGLIHIEKRNNAVFHIRCSPGESTILIAGGMDYPECMESMEEILEQGYEKTLRRTREYWLAYKSKRYDFENRLDKTSPYYDAFLRTVDDIAVLIKTQKGQKGGVLAGYNYHLAYVRDQYGVSRCLLALGLSEEAKSILEFYFQIWKRHGAIHNAQGIEADGLFHVHENDDVEITGYLILQAFDYFEQTEDREFLRRIFPMLLWALTAQERNLAGYMLPFNGDETYIAGGILPRSAIGEGSAEATLLYITGGERFLRWSRENGMLTGEEVEKRFMVLQKTKESYRRNFMKEDHLLTNNPDRLSYTVLPKFRHGVCESCRSFGWTEKNEDNDYLCPKCFQRERSGKVPRKQYHLQSVSLMPVYIHSDLFRREELQGWIEDILNQYKKTGKLPSSPDGNLTVGYDYGLLLYNLLEFHNPGSRDLFDKMLSILDDAGAWAEYYRDGEPCNTRCRPWESGINLEAAVKFMLKHYMRQ